MTTPLVSVVMPTLNGRRFIAASLRSLQTQSHGALEIIIVDDGSTDDTMAIVAEIAAQDDRIVTTHAGYGSIAKARNHGVAMARGEYLTFLDHDDLCPPGKIARQVAWLDEHPETAALFGRTVLFHSAEEVEAEAVLEATPPVWSMALAAALFRREAFVGIGPLDAAFKLSDDFDFVLRLIESGTQIEVEQEIGTLHRRHPGQATSDVAGLRRELGLALAFSVRRRRKAGNLAPLDHPLMEALR
jgi:glycosyltransferase involved in cell wall biosynthesis